MTLRQLLLSAGLAAASATAWGHQYNVRPDGIDVSSRDTPRSSQERIRVERELKLIDAVLGSRLLLACDRCRSGFALKVVEQAMQKQVALPRDQIAEVERLRAEGETLYKEKKYKESLELLLKAEELLGVDASGDPLVRPSTPPRAGVVPPADR